MGKGLLYSFVFAFVFALFYIGLVIGDTADGIANEEVLEVKVENTLDSKYSQPDKFGELHYYLIIKINSDDNGKEEITEEVNETIYNLYKKDDHINLLLRTNKKRILEKFFLKDTLYPPHNHLAPAKNSCRC